MAVYLAGSALTAAHKGFAPDLPPIGQISLNLLGEEHALPYFHALPEAMRRAEQLADFAAAHLQEAALAAGWPLERLADSPVFLASTSFSISVYEQEGQVSDGYRLDQTAELLRQRFGNPEIYTLSTACTSAAQAVVQAAWQLESGFAERAFVLGFECANRYTPTHFHAMQLLAHAPPYQPLHQNSGMVLGEACAALALSAQALSGSLKLFGFHTRSDTRSFTDTDAAELDALIDGILDCAGVNAADIDQVKAHAIGGAGDEAERALLQSRFPKSRHLALKAYTGHTLGATAAVETAWYANALTAQNLPRQTCLHYFAGFGGSMAGWITQTAA